jgi:probable rRNA maturation factor
VRVCNRSGRRALSPAVVRRLVKFVQAEETHGSSRSAVDLSVAFVDDAAMTELHGRLLGDPSPTDVLTFDLGGADPARKATVCGELVIDVEHAARAAVEHDTDVRGELMLYLVHGLLHLDGYDDKTPAGFRRMHRREDELLDAFGVGRVFSVGQAAARRRAARS